MTRRSTCGAELARARRDGVLDGVQGSRLEIRTPVSFNWSELPRSSPMGVAMSRLSAIISLFIILVLSTPASARRPADAPPLPAPDPLVYTIITVSTAQELVDAAWNLQDDQAIIIAPGTYDLTTAVVLGTFSGPLLSNVQIRGQTGDPADVQLQGAGMVNPSVLFGIRIYGATGVVIADLSVSQTYYHTVEVLGSFGAGDIQFYHCNFSDSGQQLVKINSGSGSTPAGIRFDYCDLRFSAGAPIHPELGYVYTGGVLAQTTDGLQISDCLFEGIYAQDGSVAGASVMAWQDAVGTIVERSTFLNCTRGVFLGLMGGDHQGGIVRNNFIRMDPGGIRDVAIFSASSDSRILHNSVVTNGGFAAVEVRYSSTVNVEVRQNLMDAPVLLRDSATAVVVDNITTALPAWFVDEAAGDLHLAANDQGAVDQVSVLVDSPDDFDAELRAGSPGLADIGASEYVDPVTDATPVAYSRHVLYPCAPNPFNPRTTIRYTLAQAGHVELEVYDAAGRHVRTLVRELVSAGEHEVYWSGRDDAGEAVASGVYLYQLRADSFVETRRMVLLK